MEAKSTLPPLLRNRALVCLAVCAVTLLAALLRFPWLDRLPPGLYHDEAYNGLDALAVNEGHHAIFFDANNGREPLHIYLMSLTVRLFGRTPVGVRAAGAFLGTLLVPITFLLGKEMFDEQVGLWAALMATPHTSLLCLSRTGFRAGSLTVVSAMGLAALWRGRNTGSRRWFALSGALIGLTQYTYTAARFVPLALGLGVFLTWRHWREVRHHMALLLVCTALVSLPLASYLLVSQDHREVFLARVQQVSILDPDVHQDRLAGMLGKQVIRHLRSLFLTGDTGSRHNVPGRPMLDPLASLLFAAGLAAGATTSRAKPGLTFVLGWIAAMLLPGILAEGGPSFLRLAGLLPLILLLPALGADWLWRWLLASGRSIAALFLVATVAATGVCNVLAYYVYFTQDETPFYQFEVPSTEIAAYINRFLGHGYVRDDLSALPAPSGLPRSVYVADELVHFSKTVTFLLQPNPHVHSLVKAPTTAGTGTVEKEERLLMLLPNNYLPYLYLLPPGQQIEVHVGSTMRGEFPGDQPFLLYLVFTATRPPDLAPAARFEDGISLLEYRLGRPDSEALEVQLRWRADSPPKQDYTVLVHLLEAGNLVSQQDSPPAHGYYPTGRWREGDVIVDTHRLAMPVGFDATRGAVRVGLYRPENLTRLYCATGDGQTHDSIIVPVPETPSH